MEAAQTVEATADRITHKELSKDNRTFLLYQVETDKGQFTTTKKDLAEKIHREFMHKPASFDVKIVQKGEYTNYYLEGVSGIPDPSGVFPVPGPQQPPDFTTQTQPPPFIPEPTVEPPISQPEDVSTKDLLIFRQVAAKVAAQLHRPGDSAKMFWEDVDDLVKYFVTGEKPSG